MAAFPFRMVVLGDSIMWGQGLAEGEKFSTAVQRWLTERLGRRVDAQVFAHSRAVIRADDMEDRRPGKPGEVPDRYPSITAQAFHAPRPQDVDLVLVDGGINDMGAQQILNPLHLFDLSWIRDQAHASCGRMEELLAGVILPRFKRAVVAVTGYYPLIAEQSDPLRVLELLSLLCPELAPAASGTLGALLEPLAAQSAAWGEASDAALRMAVQQANDRAPGPVSGGPPPGARVVFVPVPFGPEHCYAAPATWLWTLGEADSVVRERRAQCRRFAPLDPTCPFEAAFHPNRQGATAYAAAITRELERFLPAWGEASVPGRSVR